MGASDAKDALCGILCDTFHAEKELSVHFMDSGRLLMLQH